MKVPGSPTSSSGVFPFPTPRESRPAEPSTFGRVSSGEDASLRHAENRRHVLVVDDVPDVTDLLSVLMTHAGYEVTTASSARDAIALASDHHYDLVVSDIGMPGMNGYELARALRAMTGYESIPMVAVTGYSMFDDRTRSLSAGFNEHVTKPIDPRAFLSLIEHL